jgi:hypothetical protein
MNGTGGAFRVTKPNGECREFKASVSGLRYCDTQEHGTVLINTVADNKSKYTVSVLCWLGEYRT